MWHLKRILVSFSIISSFLQAQGADKYTDENRPYEFGFTIEGQQHRHESKDENGIIMGEFGFITADGVYHVTVYATDKEGHFKILSMKNIRTKPYPTAGGPRAEKPRNLALPPPLPKNPISPASTEIATKPPQFKPISLEPPGRSCSSCSLPTTKAPNYYKPSSSHDNDSQISQVSTEHKNQGQSNHPLNTGVRGQHSGGRPLISSSTGQNSRQGQEKAQFPNSRQGFVGQVEKNYPEAERTAEGQLTSQEYGNTQIPITRQGFEGRATDLSNNPSALSEPNYPNLNRNYPVQGTGSELTPPLRELGQNYPDAGSSFGSNRPVQGFEGRATDISNNPSALSEPNYPNLNRNYPVQGSGSELTPPLRGLGQNYPDAGSPFGSNRPASGTRTSSPDLSLRSSFSEEGSNTNLTPQGTRKNLPRYDNNSFGKTGITNQPQPLGKIQPFGQTESDKPRELGSSYESDGISNQNHPGAYSGLQNKVGSNDRNIDTYPESNVGGNNQQSPFNSNSDRSPKRYDSNKFDSPGSSSSINSQGFGGQGLPSHDGGTGTHSGKPTLISAQMQIVDKNTDIHHRGPGEKEGLPDGLTKDDMTQLLYTFNYTLGFQAHYEEGYTSGAKSGYYYVTGRDGTRTRIDYVADSKGFRPKITHEILDLLSEDVPKPETEKDEKYGLKGYEFKWLYFPVNSKLQ